MPQQPTPVSSGLRTSFRSGAPPTLHVDWIAWDSGFRGSGLRVGDQITAVEGQALTADPSPAARAWLPGQSQESAAWAARRLAVGAPLHLRVRRRQLPGEGWQVLDVQGHLLAESQQCNSAGQLTLGPGGPARLQRDGFADAWAAWYDKRVFDWERQLDGGAWLRGGDNRAELTRHLEAEARVHHLAEHHPGPFAQAVVEDWQAVHTSLAGRRYDIAPAEYAHRGVDAALQARISATARAAWQALLDEHQADIVTAPGALDPVAGQEKAYAGKLLVLPPTRADAWVTDVSRTFVSWRQNDGWVFMPLNSPAADRMWRAQHRYRRHVTPGIADEFSLLGRILPQSRLIAPKGRAAVCGLEVEPLAALVGAAGQGEAQMCVDLRTTHDGESPFAGESDVQVLPSALPGDDATPRQVLQALIDALLARDEQTWFALFADWHCSVVDGRTYYMPFDPYPESRCGPDWTSSRRIVLEKALALRIVWIDTPTLLTAGDPTTGLPRVERVRAELEHVGAFGAEQRAFVSSDVHRHWTLQRRDGGPWRIVSFQGI